MGIPKEDWPVFIYTKMVSKTAASIHKNYHDKCSLCTLSTPSAGAGIGLSSWIVVPCTLVACDGRGNRGE